MTVKLRIVVVYVWLRWSLRLIVSSSLAFRFNASGGLTDPALSHFETLRNSPPSARTSGRASHEEDQKICLTTNHEDDCNMYPFCTLFYKA